VELAPLEARIVDRPGVGKVMIGRGTTNSKGPEMACLAALHAFKAAGVKLPVNLVLVAEGEEEIGSPSFRQVVFKPEVEAALRKCVGIIIPLGNQGLDGAVEVDLGAKGVVELELVSSGEKWGRGPKLDIHSSLAAQVDSPAWHLVQALGTLVKADGHTPAVEGFFDRVRPLTPQQKKILEDAIPRKNEAATKKALGVEHWIADEAWHDSLVRLASQPTINIEGLVGGYTGPGGKTILPHKAVAKIDMRLVPDMTAKETLELLKSHLQKKGFGDIEVNMTGGYDPTETPADSKLVQAMVATYRKSGIEPLVWPRLAGSWPGNTFTGAPLKLPAGSSVWGTARGRMRLTSTGSWSRRTRRWRGWTGRRGRSWICFTRWRDSTLRADERPETMDDRRLCATPRHRLPECSVSPAIGTLWTCSPDGCGGRFDTFDTRGRCPHCGAQFAWTMCPSCHIVSAHRAWYRRSG
jgi:acetylornithine deacetylase/succinyl-diaminopimelate desuccinylase-like protein